MINCRPLRLKFPSVSSSLNGEAFTRYNLRALYPFAHQIIVAEGAGPPAAHMATPDGHSVDGTLATLRQFKEAEDPDDKVTLVTAEDEGYPNGFWPGRRTNRAGPTPNRATGDWLWQIDIDEFYRPEDMLQVCEYLVHYPATTCLTFNSYHFWGGFDYILAGGMLLNRNFQGEPWGAFRRLFKWGPGYRYTTHRPPTVVDEVGRDLSLVNKRNLTRQPYFSPIFMYHYSNVFPTQVIPKGDYYAKLSQTEAPYRKKYEDFMTPLDESRAIRIYSHFGTYNWVKKFEGRHPDAIMALRQDLANGALDIDMRPTEDIDRVLRSPKYQLIINYLYCLEWLRSHYYHFIYPIKVFVKKIILSVVAIMPYSLQSHLPKRLRSR